MHIICSTDLNCSRGVPSAHPTIALSVQGFSHQWSGFPQVFYWTTSHCIAIQSGCSNATVQTQTKGRTNLWCSPSDQKRRAFGKAQRCPWTSLAVPGDSHEQPRQGALHPHLPLCPTPPVSVGLNTLVLLFPERTLCHSMWFFPNIFTTQTTGLNHSCPFSWPCLQGAVTAAGHLQGTGSQPSDFLPLQSSPGRGGEIHFRDLPGQASQGNSKDIQVLTWKNSLTQTNLGWLCAD